MLAEREGVVHAQRRLAGDEDLFAGDIEALAEQLSKVPADGRGKLHAHDAQPPELPQQLFHLGAQVDLAAVRRERLVVRVDVRIARDAEHDLFERAVHLKHAVCVKQQDLLERNVAANAILLRQEQQLRHGGMVRFFFCSSTATWSALLATKGKGWCSSTICGESSG